MKKLLLVPECITNPVCNKPAALRKKGFDTVAAAITDYLKTTDWTVEPYNCIERIYWQYYGDDGHVGCWSDRPLLERDEYERKMNELPDDQWIPGHESLDTIRKTTYYGVVLVMGIAHSPACSTSQIYQNGKLIPGEGIFIEELKKYFKLPFGHGDMKRALKFFDIEPYDPDVALKRLKEALDIKVEGRRIRKRTTRRIGARAGI